MPLLNYQHFYLVGIKGVAMCSLAQCLLDANKNVRGSYVAEEFITQPILEDRHIKIDLNFETQLPTDTDCVIYTAAHQAHQNPQVQQALQRHVPIFSQAEALADLFNQKQGIAVCGVGGKSTTSAMIAWIFEHSNQPCSFSVGVGDISGMGKTGQWIPHSTYFVAEADDYVIDPAALSKGKKIVPRFSFLKPFITVCTNLKYDHPDVYQSFADTQQHFDNFFRQIKPGGLLIVNSDDHELLSVAQKVATQTKIQLVTYGENDQADFQLTQVTSQAGQTSGVIIQKKGVLSESIPVSLPLPGKFNLLNATAAIAASFYSHLSLSDSIKSLLQFHSTKRRFEYLGQKNGVNYYDDYAHHPTEVSLAIQAIQQWYPQNRVVIAFQSHTFSRTKRLFPDFVQALSTATEVAMIDIFPSAREKKDPSVSSEVLCDAINQQTKKMTATNYHTLENLALYLQSLPANTVVLTLGAGDIYQVYSLI